MKIKILNILCFIFYHSIMVLNFGVGVSNALAGNDLMAAFAFLVFAYMLYVIIKNHDDFNLKNSLNLVSLYFIWLIEKAFKPREKQYLHFYKSFLNK